MWYSYGFSPFLRLVREHPKFERTLTLYQCRGKVMALDESFQQPSREVGFCITVREILQLADITLPLESMIYYKRSPLYRVHENSSQERWQLLKLSCHRQRVYSTEEHFQFKYSPTPNKDAGIEDKDMVENSAQRRTHFQWGQTFISLPSIPVPS